MPFTHLDWLHFLSAGDGFRDLVKPYLLKGLTRGIPSLFSDIKSLYADVEKKAIIQEVMEGFREQYQKQEKSDDGSYASLQTQELNL